MEPAVDVQIENDLSVPFISRQDLLIAKLSADRAQDLIDVDALREGGRAKRSISSKVRLPLPKALKMNLSKSGKRGARIR